MPVNDGLAGVGRNSGARNEETRELMQAAIDSGRCPFCSPYFEEKNGERVIDLGIAAEYWHVFHNPGPLPGTALHIMIAPKRHVTLMRQLTDQELSEWQEIIEDLQDQFGFKSFARVVREGLMDFNSATVEHLHTHLVVSSGDPADEVEIPWIELELIKQFYTARVGPCGEEGALEALDEFMRHIDVFRHKKMGKAIPIRVKLSNKVGDNMPPL